MITIERAIRKRSQGLIIQNLPYMIYRLPLVLEDSVAALNKLRQGYIKKVNI